jgi:hypothetical protein
VRFKKQVIVLIFVEKEVLWLTCKETQKSATRISGRKHAIAHISSLKPDKTMETGFSFEHFFFAL